MPEYVTRDTGCLEHFSRILQSTSEVSTCLGGSIGWTAPWRL